MNISTYEARIAALEAQMGPVPGPETGLVSVVLNPDITLLDGTTLNAKLAEMMPIESTGVHQNIRAVASSSSLVLSQDYSVEVTPGASWCGLGNAMGGSGMNVGEVGSPLTMQVSPALEAVGHDWVVLRFAAGASSEPTPSQDTASMISVQISTNPNPPTI